MRRTYYKMQCNQTKALCPNIVLIGLSGSGKSSLGKRLSKKLHRPLFDTDTMVESKCGKNISQIFATYGEESFRAMESACIDEIKDTYNSIIVLGGGSILHKENIDMLSNNSLIVHIDCHPSIIIKRSQLQDRPLVNGNKEKLFSLYKERIELYRNYAQYTVKNNGRLKRAMLLIVNKLKQYQ